MVRAALGRHRRTRLKTSAHCHGSFPELGAPIGFFLSNGTYFVLESFNNQDAMLAWGWRVPFLLSAILVIVGLVVRVHMEETPIFRMAQEQKKVVKSPLTEVFRKSWRQVLQATFLVAVTYTLFYTLATCPSLGAPRSRAKAAATLASPTRNTCSCS